MVALALYEIWDARRKMGKLIIYLLLCVEAHNVLRYSMRARRSSGLSRRPMTSSSFIAELVTGVVISTDRGVEFKPASQFIVAIADIDRIVIAMAEVECLRSFRHR